MDTALYELIASVRAIPVDDRLSDDAVVALMHIHLSVMTMIVANMLEDEYGDAECHREAMEQLFAICSRRSESRQPLARRSRMIPAMYHYFCMPDALFDERKHDVCLRCTYRMADEWQEKTREARPLDEKARTVEYGVLQSILEAFAYVVDEDREADKDFLYLKRRIGEWASELDGNCCWNGLSDEETLLRIGIMAGHSDTNGDSRFDAQIDKALEACFDRIIGRDAVEARTLFGLYHALMWNAGRRDGRKTDTVAALAARMLGSADGDRRLWCMAVCIDRACARINDEIKRQMLAYSTPTPDPICDS